ncbi:MAG: macro domain-containing protein, partial [bacterium]
SCYRNSLQLAKKYGLASISFPALSTGAYGFPRKKAAEIALREVREFLKGNEILVRFVCFDGETARYYLEALKGGKLDR